MTYLNIFVIPIGAITMVAVTVRVITIVAMPVEGAVIKEFEVDIIPYYYCFF